MDSKRLGIISEQIFSVQAMQRGLDVFSPYGEYLPIDCVVMNRAGTAFKTQVKATESMVISNGAKRYGITAGGGSDKKPLDCTKVDILACYVRPEDQWYIIPCLSLEDKIKIWLYPHNPNSKGQYEKYKDSWDIFNSKY